MTLLLSLTSLAQAQEKKPLAFVLAYLTTVENNSSGFDIPVSANHATSTKQLFKLVFDKNVVNDSVWADHQEQITLVNQEGQAVAVKVFRIPDEGENANREERNNIFVTPREDLEVEQEYTVVIGAELTANNQNQLGEELRINFSVVLESKMNAEVEADVAFMVEQGLAKGRSADYFEPDARITKAEFAVLAARIFSLESEQGDSIVGNVFDDVNPVAWYAEAVNSLATKQVLEVENSLFHPTKQITKEEAFNLLINAFALEDRDIELTSEFFAEVPISKNRLTRAEAFVLAKKVYEVL